MHAAIPSAPQLEIQETTKWSTGVAGAITSPFFRYFRIAGAAFAIPNSFPPSPMPTVKIFLSAASLKNSSALITSSVGTSREVTLW